VPDLPIPAPFLTIGAGVIVFILGLAYLVRTRAIAGDFKLVLLAHRRILIMALGSQGLALCFIGALIAVVAIAAPHDACGRLVSLISAGMLLVFAVWTGSTGAQSEYTLLRLSHFVKIVAAAMIFLGQVSG
jgi:hypothetical protein